MTSMTRLLFPVEDDELLPYTLDDGMKVEPDFYLYFTSSLSMVVPQELEQDGRVLFRVSIYRHSFHY